jgi:hypothetical protein
VTFVAQKMALVPKPLMAIVHMMTDQMVMSVAQEVTFVAQKMALVAQPVMAVVHMKTDQMMSASYLSGRLDLIDGTGKLYMN